VYVDLDTFTTAVDLLAQLRELGHVRLEVTPQGIVTLAFDQDGHTEAPAAGGGLYMDIEDAIAAVAADVSVDDFVRIRSAPRPNYPQPEAEDVARAKYAAICSGFSAESLRRRAWLRATSKVYVLTSYDWEVVSKRADSTRPRPSGDNVALYGLLRLNTERASNAGWNPDHKVAVIGLDPDDVDDLLQGLTRLRAALAAESAQAGVADGGLE
jgi:hypothetical protein